MKKLLAVMGISAWLLVTYWLFWPYTPMRIDKFILDKEVVAQGDRICFTFDGAKLLPLPANVVIELVNGEAILIATYFVNNPVGTVLKSRCFNIPYHVMPKKDYQIKWTATWQVNPLRNIIKTVQSGKFEVAENHNLKGPKGDAGKQGIQGKTGAKEEGRTIFGCKPGPEGKQGKPGKSCVGKECK
jgi:hypothetical protein